MFNLTKTAVVICLSAPAKVATWYLSIFRSAELSLAQTESLLSPDI